MKLSKIKELVSAHEIDERQEKKHEIEAFFRELYWHNIQAIESIPDSAIERCFKENRKFEDNGKTFYGKVRSLEISNSSTNAETKITAIVYYDDGGCSPEETYIVKSSGFNERSVVMELNLYDFTANFYACNFNNENEFCNALLDSDLIESVFGDLLIFNDSEDSENPYDRLVNFTVDTKFFDENL